MLRSLVIWDDVLNKLLKADSTISILFFLMTESGGSRVSLSSGTS